MRWCISPGLFHFNFSVWFRGDRKLHWGRCAYSCGFARFRSPSTISPSVDHVKLKFLGPWTKLCWACTRLNSRQRWPKKTKCLATLGPESKICGYSNSMSWDPLYCANVNWDHWASDSSYFWPPFLGLISTVVGGHIPKWSRWDLDATKMRIFWSGQLELHMTCRAWDETIYDVARTWWPKFSCTPLPTSTHSKLGRASAELHPFTRHVMTTLIYGTTSTWKSRSLELRRGSDTFRQLSSVRNAVAAL
jgi:hypothetical protein